MAGAPIDRFREIVGPEHVLTDADVRAGHETDWTGRFGGPAAAIVRPGGTADVAAVVACCNQHGIGVVAQGGNTGLVGGSVPRPASTDASGSLPIVLSLRRLDHIGPVDVGAMQVTAGAGATLAAWRTVARAAGLDAPVDFAARDSATIGGAIATNAGGSRVVRFGTMRDQVAGIEAVLADGRVVGSLTGLPKETAGVHWPSLLAGSEGTLAVVTRARLRLVPRFEHTITAMVGVGSIGGAVELLGSLRTGLASLDSVEVLLPAAVELVADHLGAPAPVGPAACTVLVECADHIDPTDRLTDVLAASPDVVDSALASDPGRRDHLLAFRDRVTEAIAAEAARRSTPVFKLDVAVPVGAIDELVSVAEDAARSDGARLVPFGHLAEGNLHLNHLDATDTDRIADVVLGAVARLGGTISAEHGIGIAKTRWLPLVRTEHDLAAQTAIRRALDPVGILNPGVLDPT